MVDMHGYSADNIAFGMGGALLQQLDRDTQKFAMKCSSAEVNGEWVDVFKDPVTDQVKASKKGRVTLWRNGSEFASGVTAPTGWTDKGIGPWTNALVPVYWNGNLHNGITFEQVRANARK
jgi:nicotinamide phosphoribosyltransferase